MAALCRRGRRVATIKHHRQDLDIDHEGKDSRRHKEAGAFAVAIVTPEATAVVRDEHEEPDPREIVERYLFDADIVLAEGYKTAQIPKIALISGENPEDMELAMQSLTLAIVSDSEAAVSGLPVFRRDDVNKITEFIEERFLRAGRSAKVSMLVDGKRLPMKPFVRDLVDSVIRALVGTFKGAENASKITVFLEK